MGRRPEALLVWGGGGHGKVVADLVRARGMSLCGYVDRDAAKLDRVVEPGGGRVVMSEESLVAHVRAHGACPPGATGIVPAIGDNRARERCVRLLGDLAAPPLVHPSAVVSPSAVLLPGTVVFAGAVVNADARIGRGVIVNSGAIVEHDCRVGEAVHLSPRSMLGGGAAVGDRSWVGAGAVVLPGVRIGADVIVGAGAVVLRDVESGRTVVGVPARQIG